MSAYNSDGYIMVDFADVDFRQTNQYIEGLYDRIAKVVGTNKFFIVINANNKTPLPSTVSITNGQYVIESAIYSFSINSSDMIHISKHTNADELIDDDHSSTSTTYSSNKINALLAALDYLKFIEFTRQLVAGSTTITILDERIRSTSTCDRVYTSIFGILPTNIVITDGSCVITFEEQASNIDVKVRIY